MSNTDEQTPKILIVDDKAENLYALKKLLGKLDADVYQASSGFEAMELAVKYDFSVAIVDVQMPEMDGYELVEFLRHNRSTQTLPVIFVSAIFSDEYHHRKGYEAGAVDFMSKPFNPEILLSKIKVFLELYRQRRELQEANEKLSKRAIELETSSQVARHAASILDLEQLLPEVVSLVQAMFNYYCVGLWLADDDKQHLILRDCRSNDGRQPLEAGHVLLLDTPKSIITSAYRKREYHLADDVTTDPEFLDVPELPKTRAELALPLQIGGEIIGVLDFQSDEADVFGRDTQMVLQMLANQISIAIHNAQLFGQEKNLRQLEARKAQELADLNASKDRFFSIVAHDLRGPFMPLLGTTKLMADLPDSVPVIEFKDMAHSVHRAAANVFNLLENLLQWSRMQRGRMDCEPAKVDLNEMTGQTVKLLTDMAAGKSIALSAAVPDNVIVYVDENMLDTVLRNLTTNALKFTPPDGRVTISAQPAVESAGFIEISVSDTGVGISKEDQAKLFKLDQTHTTQGTASEQGSGLGLIICQEMVEKNGGQIWIESEVGLGTSVKFTVPLAEDAFVDWNNIQSAEIAV